MKRIGRLDLRAKVIIILIAVILPTFLLVTLVQNKITRPILAEDMKQIGISTGKSLAAEIVTQRLFWLSKPGQAIESRIQEIVYSQPNIVRIDVAVRDFSGPAAKIIASNIEEDPAAPPQYVPQVDSTMAVLKTDESGMGFWDVTVPIDQRGRDPKAPRKIYGNVHVAVSLKFVKHAAATVWKITASAAALSVVLLIVLLSFFLRKTIANDRLLRRAEDQNILLASQLHEAERQLMNVEKLAVMGQLTASFAHEIGTPLGAITGHLDLLRDELPEEAKQKCLSRLEIVSGQVSKIGHIVKNFLQSTVKPVSQRQLVDVNVIADQTLGIVKPRIDALGIDVKREFDRDLGPVRAVPVDLEQVLLNLINNSLDSLKAKARQSGKRSAVISVATRVQQSDGREWAVMTVYDTGQGIKRTDLPKISKPFFTTKRPGEGTGLGLAICHELVRKYGGRIDIDSREGAWTRVDVRIPYMVVS
ncbi:MAG: hypothetical protein A2583_02495 [Bdellovibrionales bacterium RIFOXYD1_FULL_53_11]|nr:MAG: hypothetical protein A2583_02495 [Bdellovibrionales bacterium RIFOXYD1_FULL_53_11]